MAQFKVGVLSGTLEIQDLGITLTTSPVELLGPYTLSDILDSSELLAGLENKTITGVCSGLGVTALVNDLPIYEFDGSASQEAASIPALQTRTITVSGQSTVSTDIDFDSFFNITTVKPLPGAQIIPVGVVDPDSVSTNEANLINGDFSDLVYNNSAASTYPFNMPAVDLGSVQSVSMMRLYLWTNPSYLPRDYDIQVSDDNSSYTTVLTGLDAIGKEADSIDHIINSSCRYVRIRVNTSANATYCVISEIETYAASTQDETVSIYSEENLSFSSSTSGTLELINGENIDLDFRINYLQ